MKKTAIAVFVSGGGTNLQALIDAAAAGKLESGEIKLVLASNPKAYALERAKKANIETAVVTPKEPDAEDKIQSILAAHGIQMIVLAGYMSILSERFTKRWENRILNVHPSLIPAFCGKGFYGLRVHEAALERGVKVTGATVHFVNEIPDGGEILLQKAVEILPGDTPETLQKRVMEQAEWKLLPAAAELVANKLMNEENCYVENE